MTNPRKALTENKLDDFALLNLTKVSLRRSFSLGAVRQTLKG